MSFASLVIVAAIAVCTCPCWSACFPGSGCRRWSPRSSPVSPWVPARLTAWPSPPQGERTGRRGRCPVGRTHVAAKANVTFGDRVQEVIRSAAGPVSTSVERDRSPGGKVCDVARVLVADDDPDLLALARVTLELAGHEVETASDRPGRPQSGHLAARRRGARHHDADARRPLHCQARLRQGPKTQSIPVLLLSAKAGAIDIEVGMKAGAAGYITKPFAPADLVSAIVRITAKG